MVDNLLGKTKSSAIPCFSPDDHHDFIDSGVRRATKTSSPPILTPCSTTDQATFTTVSVYDVICAIRISPSKQWPLTPFNVTPRGICVHHCFVNHAHTQSVAHWWLLPVALAGIDDSIVSSYRPVSNLQHISKILERIGHRQVISHLEEFKLLPDVQSAYCNGHSTQGLLRSYRRHLK